MNEQETRWNESDTELFLKYGEVFVPERNEIAKAFINLIPAGRQETFTAVDIGVGGGWLTETILEHFPNADVIALDGSEGMINHTKERLSHYESRLKFRKFNLLDESWHTEFENKVKCFVSSLVIHHLDDHGKQKLFKSLYRMLQQDGALLIADILKPANEKGRVHMSRSWDEITKMQSLDLLGNLKAYNFFINEKWNLFEYPDDPIDKPSTLGNQLRWMEQSGLTGVDTFWAKAGHALFGGYKS